MRVSLLILLGFTAACTPGTVQGDLTHVRFDLSWHQTKEQLDMVQCHYLKTPNADDVEIDRITVNFPLGSHHVHVYRSDIAEPTDHVEDCTAGIDWTRWSLLVGVQSKPLDWSLSDGVTVPLKAHQQLLVQVHWLNL